MVIWEQTSLFTYNCDQSLENILPRLKSFGETTSFQLTKDMIQRYSNPGDLILDPCCGRGITGFTAWELDRRFVLSDINPFDVFTVDMLCKPFDYAKIMLLWQEMIDVISAGWYPVKRSEEWDNFVNTPLPKYAAFKRLIGRSFEKVWELFCSEDLQVLESIYHYILKISDKDSQEFLRCILINILLESSQIALSRNGQSFYMPKKRKSKDAFQIFQMKLELFLRVKELIGVGNDTFKSEIKVASVFDLQHVKSASIDYCIMHLPEINSYSVGELNFLHELLLDNTPAWESEFIINLDYRGRYRLQSDLNNLFSEIERVLKDDKYCTLIFTGHHVLLTLIIQLAGKEGWQLIQDEVVLNLNSRNSQFPTIGLTLQKKSQHKVLGALNKMKYETLYDTEEAILRKIDQYLSEHGTASKEEIQRHLIVNYLHDCLIERSLEELLSENFVSSGKYWIRPSREQKNLLYNRRREVMREAFPEFVREMTYRFLSEEHKGLNYEDLLHRFSCLRPRGVFYTPYYRLLTEECDQTGQKLAKLVLEYLTREKKDQFESLADVLRRLLRGDASFIEIIPGELIGLVSWPGDDYFKIYLELFEKARRKGDKDNLIKYRLKCLEYLDEVTYLDIRKKGKIKEYLMRSE